MRLRLATRWLPRSSIALATLAVIVSGCSAPSPSMPHLEVGDGFRYSSDNYVVDYEYLGVEEGASGRNWHVFDSSQWFRAPLPAFRLLSDKGDMPFQSGEHGPAVEPDRPFMARHLPVGHHVVEHGDWLRWEVEVETDGGMRTVTSTEFVADQDYPDGYPSYRMQVMYGPRDALPRIIEVDAEWMDGRWATHGQAQLVT